MAKIHNPTVAYSTVVPRRRRSRAAAAGERFQLGVHDVHCRRAPWQRAVALIGASSWALKSEQVERTVEIIGTAGGLLADPRFQVCPIVADAPTQATLARVWVCGDETQADEHTQLAAMGVAGPLAWFLRRGPRRLVVVTTEELEDRTNFIRYFAAQVEALIGANVSNNLSNEPPRTDPDDAGRAGVDKAADLHQRGRRRTHPDRANRDSSGS